LEIKIKFVFCYLQDPTPFFNEIRDDRKIDMATCRDFRVKCTNTGIIYFKSTPSTQMFLNNWLTWIWWHPYEFSQKAFASFFGIEEVSRFFKGVIARSDSFRH